MFWSAAARARAGARPALTSSYLCGSDSAGIDPSRPTGQTLFGGVDVDMGVILGVARYRCHGYRCSRRKWAEGPMPKRAEWPMAECSHEQPRRDPGRSGPGTSVVRSLSVRWIRNSSVTCWGSWATCSSDGPAVGSSSAPRASASSAPDLGPRAHHRCCPFSTDPSSRSFGSAGRC